MTRKYFSRVFCFLLWISIFFALSFVFSPKASAQVCSFEGYSPPVTPNPAFCTPYFPDTIAFPPCNTERACSNKAFKANGIGTVNANCSVGGSLDGTQCCAALNPNFFCDQKSLGPGVITEYQFRCCNIPPPPTPTPTPSCVGSVGGNCNSTPCCSPLVCTSIDVYTRQCRGTPPTPIPTPTPTPSQKFLIRGVVYIDRDNNGVVTSGDTLAQGSSLRLEDVTTGSGGFPKSFPTTDTGGFYITSRIWDDRHFVLINLQTIPAGCTAASNPRTIQIFGSDATSNFPLVCQPTSTPPPTAGPTPIRTPPPTPPPSTPTPTPPLVACPAPRDGSIVTQGGSQWRCISSCRGISHGRLTCDFGDVCCEFPFATPTPTVGPTPFPTPFPSPPGCGACGTCNQAGNTWMRYCSSFNGCTSSGCTPPPTPGPTSAPTPTPTPTPIPPCPAGTREKTVTKTANVNLGIHYWSYQVDWPTGNCGRNTNGTTTTVDNNLRINHRINKNKTLSCSNIFFNQWNWYTDSAVFSFNNLNIPKDVKIQSAVLSSSTDAACETALVSGRIGSVSAGDFSGGQPPAFPNQVGVFGKDKFNFHEIRDCRGFLTQPVLDSCSERNALLHRKADATSFIGSVVASQNLDSVSFQLSPDYQDYICSAGQDVFGAKAFETVFSSNFSVNNPGPASLSVKYCEPLYSVSGNVFEDENKNRLKEGKEVNYSLGISTIEVHTGIDALCSSSTLGIPTLPPPPTPTPSCIGNVGGNCNAAPCCSPLVCTAVDVYTRQCRGTPPPIPLCNKCDSTGDGCFNTADTGLIGCFGKPATGACANRDVNNDGRINISDITACANSCACPTPPPNPSILSTATGTYTTDKILPAGTYTFCYTSLPVTYKTTFPATNPPQFNLTVGPSCSSGTSNSATCGTLPTPTPTPIPGCRKPGPVGRSCSGVICCSGLSCVPGDIYNAPFCPNPPPASPPDNKNIINANFGIVADIFSISGTIFTDTNGDLKKNPQELNYLGPVNISITNGFANFVVSNSNGNYSSNNLPQGQYTIIFSGLPKGSVFTYPSTPLIVNVGQSCSFPITSEGRCSFGSILSLNAGVTNSASNWFQSQGSDMRWDSGFTNAIPKNKFASILGTGGMPGIIFSGKTTPSFGQGQASEKPFNWKVGSFADPEVFTDTHSLIPTSYRFLLETADASAIAKKKAAELCGNGSSSDCALNPDLVHGVYAVDGDLTLNGSGYTFPANQDFVILVNGNLNINEEIHVPTGSTAIFSAKGNITVNKNIGETQSSTAASIEGLYSADGNFTADGNKNCSLAKDLRLNVAGSVIANAGRIGGTFVNNRDMCAGNSSFPSVSFIERPDFMLNYPNLVKQTTRAWQEAAP